MVITKATIKKNGIIKEIGKYKINKRIGEWREYDDSGQLIRMKKFQNGKKLSNPDKCESMNFIMPIEFKLNYKRPLTYLNP